MAREMGSGFDGLQAILGTAVSWTPSGDEVCLVDRAALIDAAREWSGLPDTMLEAAFGLLTLRASDLKQEGLRYWDQETREFRLLTRPLVEVDGQVVIMPWVVDSAQSIFAANLVSGRLPWPTPRFPMVDRALNEFRKLANAELEEEAASVAVAMGLAVCRNLKPEQAKAAGLLLSGEIDLLIADTQRSRLWVCEVKDQGSAASPSTLRQGLNRFVGRKGHVAKLQRKRACVQGAIDAFAGLVTSEQPSEGWRAVALMVTRRVESAAFLEDPGVPYVVIADLRAALTQASDPESGLFPISLVTDRAG
jgi:hypothetical protein